MYQVVPDSNKLNVDGMQTLNHFTKTDDGAGSNAIGKHVISQIAVGNFDGNEYGCEQIAYTVMLQGNTSKHYYYIMLQMAGGANYEENISSGYYNKWSENYIIDRWEHGYSKRCNIIIASIDRDDDGIVASYRGADYVWTDPQVRAVLQASPYFKDLYDAGYITDDYETSYSTSVTYGYEKGKTKNVSFGVGVAYDADFKFMTLDAKIGFALDWSKSYSKSLETTYTQTFSAKQIDTVIMYRTPVFIYYYDIWTKNDQGVYDSTIYEIAVPKGPVYDQISVDSYNEFVTYYNNYLAKNNIEASSLSQINKEKLYLGNSGNPYGYLNSSGANLLGSSPNYYGEFKNIAKNGGSNGSSYEINETEAETTEMSYGFSFELALAGGFTGGGYEMHLGGYVDLDAMFGTSVTKTNGYGTEYEATVSGIYTNEMKNDGLNPDDYSFAWRLASWDSTIKDNTPNSNAIIPVIGYVLQDVTSPSMPVDNLDLEFTRDENKTLVFDLSWSLSDYYKNDLTKGDNIYLYDIFEKEYLLIDTISDKSITSYTYTHDYDGREYYNFMVRSFKQNSEVSPKVESVAKTITQYMPSMTNPIISITKTNTSVDGLIDTYTITFQDYSTQTFEVANGRGVVDVKKVESNSETLIDKYIITFSDGYTSSFEIKNGQDGAGITSIDKVSSDGLVDTYMIYYANGLTKSFTVTNGKQGIEGIQGEKGEDGHTPVVTIGDNGNWFIDGIDTEKIAQGLKGDKGDKGDIGVSVVDITIDEDGNFIFNMSDGSVINAGKPKETPNEVKTSSCNSAKVELLSSILVLLPLVRVLLRKKH